MPQYAVAFHDPQSGCSLKLVQAEDRAAALRQFFDQGVEGYSQDAEGWAWFREDFEDAECPSGSIAEIQ